MKGAESRVLSDDLGIGLAHRRLSLRILSGQANHRTTTSARDVGDDRVPPDLVYYRERSKQPDRPVRPGLAERTARW